MSHTVDVHCRGDEGNESSTSGDENRILTSTSLGEDEISCLPSSATQEGHTSLSRITPYKSAQRRWSLNFSRTRKPIRSATVPLVQTKKFRLSIDDQVHQKYENILQITQDFEGHQDLMEDSDFAKTKRDEIIRSLPQALSMKKEIRENLARTIRRHSSLVEDSFWKDCADNWKLFFVRVQMWYQLVNRLEIWYNALKEVEGFFGSSVGSYFKFLRFLFALNVVAAILVTGFIMMPQIMFNWSDDPVIERQVAAKVVENFTETWKEMRYRVERDASSEERGVRGRDLISGGGVVADTTFFYGAYTNETFSLNGQTYYSMPNAFVIVIMVVYAVIFLILSVSVGRSYRHSFIESSGSVHTMFSHKILCAWDFGISNTKAAGMKRQAILTEFREMLHEANVSYVTRSTKCHRIWSISTQIAAHALCIFMLAGLAVGLWTILTDDLPILCLLINITLTIYQNMFRWIAKLEEYKSPGTILHIHLLRNFLLEVTIIGVLLFYWIHETQSCWETKVGQELYRIVVSDLILTVLVVPAYYGGRYALHRNFSTVFDLPHFDISHACLKLVFNQTLMWIGVVYAPVLPVLMVGKMVVLFYLKKFVLLRFCKPPEKLWRSSQTQTTFMVLTFLSLFAVTVTNGYIAVQVPVSPSCGPFRGYTHMFDIIATEIDDLKQYSIFWSIVASLTKPAVIAGILLTMSVIVYYLRARSRAHIAMVKLLKEMLYLEGKDKEFLLDNIKRLTQDAGFFFDDSEVVFKRHRRMASGDWMFKSQRSAYNIGLNNNNNSISLDTPNGKAKNV